MCPACGFFNWYSLTAMLFLRTTGVKSLYAHLSFDHWSPCTPQDVSKWIIERLLWIEHKWIDMWLSPVNIIFIGWRSGNCRLIIPCFSCCHCTVPSVTIHSLPAAASVTYSSLSVSGLSDLQFSACRCLSDHTVLFLSAASVIIQFVLCFLEVLLLSRRKR